MTRQRRDLIDHLERVHKFGDEFRLDRASDEFLDALHDIDHETANLARPHEHDYLTVEVALT